MPRSLRRHSAIGIYRQYTAVCADPCHTLIIRGIYRIICYLQLLLITNIHLLDGFLKEDRLQWRIYPYRVMCLINTAMTYPNICLSRCYRGNFSGFRNCCHTLIAAGPLCGIGIILWHNNLCRDPIRFSHIHFLLILTQLNSVIDLRYRHGTLCLNGRIFLQGCRDHSLSLCDTLHSAILCHRSYFLIGAAPEQRIIVTVLLRCICHRQLLCIAFLDLCTLRQ